jgi:hypothetical protein
MSESRSSVEIIQATRERLRYSFATLLKIREKQQQEQLAQQEAQRNAPREEACGYCGAILEDPQFWFSKHVSAFAGRQLRYYCDTDCMRQ